ncbi:MAG: aminotransferase class I/II-fold pyridoxal phosphate-dependent enzyme [Oscillospiraceae bacterium]|nr:aminotransferase class I/II-fold pyridoxal phosphate-dependent enzyme [Oscillospiraceae bacterium]
MNNCFDVTPDHRHNGSFRWDLPGAPEDVIGMGTADLDFYCAPGIRNALMKVAEENCYNYRQHPDEYYSAVCNWYHGNYGLDVQKEWLSNVPSTIGAIRMALGILAEPGDKVIVQTPVFGPVTTAIEGAGLVQIDNPMTVATDRYEIDFDDFEAKVRRFRPKVFLMVNPHNPTGRAFSGIELERLIDICYENGVKVISDEVHCLIIYEGHRHTPVLAVSDRAREIAIQVLSLSKGYNIMSLPHAIVTVADPGLREAWDRQIASFSFGYAVNSFAIAAVTAILKGEANERMGELKRYLKRNIDETIRFISDQRLPLKPYTPEAGFLLWIDCRNAGIGEENLDTFFMERCHIHLDDGEKEFGPCGRGFIRINLAVTNKVLKQALERIRSIFG